MTPPPNNPPLSESDSLFVVPQRTAEPERHDELSDSDHNGTDVEAVAVHALKPTDHVQEKDADDEALHDGVGDYTQDRGRLLLQVDTQHLQLYDQRLPVGLCVCVCVCVCTAYIRGIATHIYTPTMSCILYVHCINTCMLPKLPTPFILLTLQDTWTLKIVKLQTVAISITIPESDLLNYQPARSMDIHVTVYTHLVQHEWTQVCMYVCVCVLRW